MAKKVKELPERLGGGMSEQYPWDEWLDGDVWMLAQGEDFDVVPTSFANTVRSAAKRRGYSVTTRIRGNSIYVQRM